MRILNFALAALAASLAITACSPVNSYETVQLEPTATAIPTRLATEVYFYPEHGQSPYQQDRDRYECYLWAVRQSGFDPSKPHLAPHQRVLVAPQPPAGYDTAAGMVTGALLGAAIGAPHSTGEGAVIGAVAGAALGAASDAARQDQAARIQQRYDQQTARSYAELDRQARNYRRAMAACLEGRGYSVR